MIYNYNMGEKGMKRLKELRKLNNLTQQEIAEKLFMTPNGYGHYENGKTQPNIQTLIKLAEFFNVSIDYLVGREDFNNLQLDSTTKELIEVCEQLDTISKGRVLGYAKGRLEAQKEVNDIKVITGYRA